MWLREGELHLATGVRHALYGLLSFVAMFTPCASTQSGERVYHTIVVYSDGSADYPGELRRFMELVSEEKRKAVVDGEALGRDVALEGPPGTHYVYFGRSRKDEAAWRSLPAELRKAAKERYDIEEVDPADLSATLRAIQSQGGDVHVLCDIGGHYDKPRGLRFTAAFNPYDRADCRTRYYAFLLRLDPSFCERADCASIIDD